MNMEAQGHEAVVELYHSAIIVVDKINLHFHFLLEFGCFCILYKHTRLARRVEKKEDWYSCWCICNNIYLPYMMWATK